MHDVRTVHVPVFQSESFRRNLDYLLTEAVQREIRTRTPYRLDDAETADTILKAGSSKSVSPPERKSL